MSVNSKEELNNILNSFKVRAECVAYTKIRNVSLYDLRLEPGTRVKGLQKFADEIALAIKAKARPLVKVITDMRIVRLEVIRDSPHKI